MNFIYDVSKEPDPSKDGGVLENLSAEELDMMVSYLIAAKSGTPLFSGEQRERIQEICDRYAAHEVTMGHCEFIVASGLRHGFDFEQALLGLRLGLSHEYDTREYFTVSDISRITGETPEEIESYMREHERELLESGQLAKVSFVDPRK